MSAEAVPATIKLLPKGTKLGAVWDVICPGGAVGFSPGFQPWETSNKAVRPERARGYQMNFASIVAQDEGAQLRGPTIGLYFRVASRFDLAPLQHLQPGGPGVFRRTHIHVPCEGASLRGVWFPGLKPWAKSCSPFGAGLLGRRTCAKHTRNPGLGWAESCRPPGQ
jgi:hypothetical protein